jgi:phosphohistidine swiveling domain-containing protein
VNNKTINYKVVRARKLYPFPGCWNYESETQLATEKLHGIRIETVWVNWENDMFTAVYDNAEWDAAGHFIADKIKTDSKYLTKIYHDQKIIGEKAILYAKEITATNLSLLSQEELMDSYKQLKKTWIDYDHVNVYPWFIGGDYYQNNVLGELKEKYLLSESEAQMLVTSPTPSFSHNEEVLLYRSATDSIKDPKLIEKYAQILSEKFYWIAFGYDGPLLNTKEVYEKIIRDIVLKGDLAIETRLSELSALVPDTVKKHREIIGKYSITSFEVALLEKIYVLAEMTDYRKEVTFQIHVALFYVMAALAEKFGFTNHLDLRFVTIEELENKSKSELEKLIQDRRQGSIYITHKGELSILIGEEAEKLREQIFTKVQSSNLKGQVASRGKTSIVRGVVRVVMQSAEIDKVQVGEILVTAMTTPEYVPAMRKVIAVLTDEGGVTCHAAIVSRELGIPAVIAIGNATKVLKDGDLVEVDAEKGIVTKLS